MSLRDQFLKAGLVSKKQAKKATNKAKVEKRQQDKELSKGQKKSKSPQDHESEVVKQYKVQMEQQKEKDRQLNQEIENLRKEKEAFYRAKELIITRDQTSKWADIVYRFIVNEKNIHSVRVTEEQLELLAEGSIGIARIDKDDNYYLLSLSDCQLISSIQDGMIICLHLPLLGPPVPPSLTTEWG